MAGTTKASVLAAMRLRVGDTSTTDPFLTDNQWNAMIDSASSQLRRFARKETEVTITGNDTYTYTIPSSAQTADWSQVFVRSNNDPSTDIPLVGYRVVGTTLYTKYPISSSQKIVIWVRSPYALDTDTFTTDVLEVLYMMCELAFIRHAVHRRADFEQWASINRSDASIQSLVAASGEIRLQLKTAVEALSNGTEVYSLGSFE